MDDLLCSYCGKSKDQVTSLIAGGSGQVFICEECVALCVDILDE